METNTQSRDPLGVFTSDMTRIPKSVFGRRYRCRKQIGQCGQCGKNKPADGRKRCLRCIDHSRGAIRRYNLRRKLEMVEAYGGECVWCAENNPNALNIDHINEDGAAHRRAIRREGGSSFICWLKKNNWPRDNLRLLCYTCNCGRSLGRDSPRFMEHRKALGVLRRQLRQLQQENKLPPELVVECIL